MFSSVFVALAAAAFVWLTSKGLPAVVASHFDGGGAANGFMSRHLYTWFMLAFTVGLPLLLVYLPNVVLRNERMPINLPNRSYWLAPERRSETVEYLCHHNARFVGLLVLFLCYVHWLVVRANAVTPPRLSSPLFIAGLVVFGLSGVVWLVVLLGRFRRVPRGSA